MQPSTQSKKAKLNTAPLRHKVECIVDEILKDIKPTKEDVKDSVLKLNLVMGRLKKAAPSYAELIVTGSTAKGTNLRGDSDVDIFMLLPKSVKKEDMEGIAAGVAKKFINTKDKESYLIEYAEHPYVRISLPRMALEVELVPAYKITNALERGTAVDRTQLHNIFVNSTLSKKQKDDVRALKAFMKFNHVYGAEASVEGFSGYLTELLIAKYGSFFNVLYAFSCPELPLVIDDLNLRKNSMPKSNIVGKFEARNIIVLDPTDDNRNVAASVSNEAMAKFSLSCRRMLKNPDIKSFFGPKIFDINSSDKLASLASASGLDVFVIVFYAKRISKEIIWQQTRRISNAMRQYLEKSGVYVRFMFQEAFEDGSVLVLLNEHDNMAPKVAKGPSVFIPDAFERFSAAHKGSIFKILEGDVVYSVERREKYKTEDIIRRFLKNFNVPKNLLRKPARIYKNNVPEEYAKLAWRAFILKNA